MSLYAEERQQRILTQARGDGRVEVASLSAEFGVTQETVRRDLDRLERQGLLRRVRLPGSRPPSDPQTAVAATERTT